MINAVVFDLDGVLLDSEQVWDRARREVAAEHGGRWTADATAAMQRMSSPEWARYMREEIGIRLELDQIIDAVVRRVLAHYEAGLPLLPGPREAVDRLARRWRLGLASSSNRVIIDRVLAMAELAGKFATTASSEEVGRGKPAPDVYLAVLRSLAVSPAEAVGVEDSANGIRSATAAGMKVVALPNREFPPPPAVLAKADLVLASLYELTVEQVEGLAVVG